MKTDRARERIRTANDEGNLVTYDLVGERVTNDLVNVLDDCDELEERVTELEARIAELEAILAAEGGE